MRWKGGDFPYRPTLHGTSMIVMLRGYTIGADNQNIFQDTQSLRDDLTTSYNCGGRHDVKIGGEYLRFHNRFIWCLRCNGVIDATASPVPANIEQLFPVWNDASTWNVAPLAPITRWVFHSLSDTEHRYEIVRHLFAGWVQDDWKVAEPLTLNIGVRYDIDTNSYAEKTRFLPWLPGNLPHDTNNLAPRLGTSYKLNDRTALRGGYRLVLRVCTERRDSADRRLSAPFREPDPQRRHTRFHDRPRQLLWLVPRTKAKFRRRAETRMRCQLRVRLRLSIAGAGNQLSRSPDVLQPSGICRHPAAVRCRHVAGGELRVHRRTA